MDKAASLATRLGSNPAGGAGGDSRGGQANPGPLGMLTLCQVFFPLGGTKMQFYLVFLDFWHRRAARRWRRCARKGGFSWFSPIRNNSPPPLWRCGGGTGWRGTRVGRGGTDSLVSTTPRAPGSLRERQGAPRSSGEPWGAPGSSGELWGAPGSLGEPPGSPR